jgi:hypothetical protein
MGDDDAREFAAASRALVVAAAGCGKTDLITRAVRSCDRGRQLVLTHTHAGVRVLRERLLDKYRVASSHFVVDTIDGWALCYAASYPSLSGLGDRGPADLPWARIRQAATTALQRRAIRDVVTRSYTGLYVDEYQDCTQSQHALVCALADILPCRIVGDPMQGIFDFDDRAPQQGNLFESPDPCPDWQQEVERRFPRLRELQTPYRWQKQNANPALGDWLRDVRSSLTNGTEIDLNGAPVHWNSLTGDQRRYPAALKACHSLATETQGSIVVICWQRNPCYALGKKLRGRFRYAERLDCPELFEWTTNLERLRGPARAAAAIDIAEQCTTTVPAVLKSLGREFRARRSPGPRLARKYPELKTALVALASADDLAPAATAFQRVEEVCGRQFHRHELWAAMRETLGAHDPRSGRSLAETARCVRDQARRYGRRLSRYTIGTTWLVKGLEFDHAIVVGADDAQFDARNLYVAITRACKSLTILSASRRVKKAPAWEPTSVAARAGR